MSCESAKSDQFPMSQVSIWSVSVESACSGRIEGAARTEDMINVYATFAEEDVGETLMAFSCRNCKCDKTLCA